MSERLDLLRPTLDTYRREFSVLDIGSGINHPSIGWEIGHAYPNAVVTQIEKDWAGEPTMPAKSMVLKREITVDELRRLSECEHFDVVIAFNILHWFENWREMFPVLTQMGKWLFIQIPDVAELGAPNAFEVPAMAATIRDYPDATLIGETVQFPRHAPRPLWRLDCAPSNTRTLTRTCMRASPDTAETKLVFDESYNTAKIRNKSWGYWEQGINLQNFIDMGGVWPSREAIAAMIEQTQLVKGQRHGDIAIHNFVLNGARTYLIDGYENWGDRDAENLQAIVASMKGTS